jgi:hypothetical protein
MVVLGGAAIYIAVNLSNQNNVTPEDAQAYTYSNCPVMSGSLGTCQMPDGQCTGPICMQGVKYNLNSSASCNPGQMVNCYSSGPVCATAQCGPCSPDCGSGTAVDPVGGNCPSGSTKTRGTCSGCDNPYWGCCEDSTPPESDKIACGDYECGDFGGINCDHNDNNCYDSMCEGGPSTYRCERTLTSGDKHGQCQIRSCPSGYTLSLPCTCVRQPITTVPYTPTETPTNTPTVTNTPTITPSISIPNTALVTDEVDRILMGIGMVFVGIIFYKNDLYYSSFFFIKNAFIVEPNKKDVGKFEEKVQNKFKSKK